MNRKLLTVLLFVLVVVAVTATPDKARAQMIPPPADLKVEPKAEPGARVKASPILTFMADLLWYKANGKADFDVNLALKPFSFEFPVNKLEAADVETFRKNAEEEICRLPKNKDRKVEKVIAVQFTLSEDAEQIVGCIVFFEGKDGAGKALNLPGKTAAVRLTFAEAVWTPDYSRRKTLEWRQRLHDTLGVPDRGEVMQRAIQIIEDKLFQANR